MRLKQFRDVSIIDSGCLSPVVEFVTVVVCGDDVQQQDVFGFEVESGHPELHLGEHLPRKTIKKYTFYPRIHLNYHKKDT